MSDINIQTFSGKVNISNNLKVGSGHLFVDTQNNRVGLVTNAPDAGLHVNSNAYVHSDFRVGSGIVMNEKVATFGTTKTFLVTVVQVGGSNKFHIDGVDRPSIQLHENQTYIFDQSHSSNAGHPFAFSKGIDGSANSNSYTTGITTNYTLPALSGANGDPGSAGAKSTFVVPVGAPSSFYYYCTVHGAGMGNIVTASTVSTDAEVIVSGRFEADFLHGDGSNIENITSSQWTTVNANELYYDGGNVGIGVVDPQYKLDVAGDINIATGSSLLMGGVSPVFSNWVLDGSDIYRSSGNVGISNNSPQHTLSVGSNLYVDDAGSNVLVVDGNVAANQITLGQFAISSSYGLDDVVNESNTATKTVHLSNVTTGLVTTGNVEVGGDLTVTGNVVDLTVTGNVEVGGDLTVTGNVVDLTVTGNVTVGDDLTVSDGVTSTTSLVSNAMTIGTTKTFVVTVSDASGANKYYIDGVQQPSLTLHQHQTYIFDLSSSTLLTHPFIFSETGDGTGTPYTTGITPTGDYGSSETRTFVVPAGAPTPLYYYCTAHPGMGATISISPEAELIVSGSIMSKDLVVTGTSGMSVGGGTTAQRPVNPATGMLRYNSTTGFMEAYSAVGWAPIAQPPTVTGISPLTTASSGGNVEGFFNQTDIIHPNMPVLTSGDNNGDQFGKSVSMTSDGTRAIVGVPYDNIGSFSSYTEAGSAQIFKRTGTTWAWEAEFVNAHVNQTSGNMAAGSAAISDYFGTSVAISDDGIYAVVGAPADDKPNPGALTDAGSAHIYMRSGTTWTNQHSFFSNTPAANDRFGISVSINSDGTRALIGSEQEIWTNNSAGSAEVWVRNTATNVWSYEANLTQATSGVDDHFGHSLSLSSDGVYAIVGAWKVDSGGNSENGEVVIFVRDTGTNSWARQATFSSSRPSARFGWDVDINTDGTRVVVGAVNDYAQNAYIGTADVWVRNTGESTWALEARLAFPDTKTTSDSFGDSVSISSDGTRVAVGAHQHDYNSIDNSGSAHTFIRNTTTNTWTLKTSLYSEQPTSSGSFGDSVALSGDGDYLLIGEPRKTITDLQNGSSVATNAGSVEVYTFKTQVFDASTQVFTATGTGIVSGSTVQLEGADGSLYSVSNVTVNSAGTQATFKMPIAASIMSPSEYDAVNNDSYSIYFEPNTPSPTQSAGNYGTFLYDNGAGVNTNNYIQWSDHPPNVALAMAQMSSFGGGTPPNCPATQLWIDIDRRGANTYRIVGVKSAPSGGFLLGVRPDGFVVAQQPYKVRINSTSGLTGTSTAKIGFPVGWTTAAGVDLLFDTTASTTQTLAGTDGGGGTNRKFTIVSTIPVSSPPALPSPLTLTEAGVINGTIAAVGTTSVTFRLTDNVTGLFTDRAINIVGTSSLYTWSPNPFTFGAARLNGSGAEPVTDEAQASQLFGANLSDFVAKSSYSSAAWRTNTAYFKLGTSGQHANETGFQLWTVPITGTYTIKAYGAAGGGRTNASGHTPNGSGHVRGGYGAWTQGNFALTKGEKVLIIVGHVGRDGSSYNSTASGGGGGTYVLKELGASTAVSNSSIYCIAGGGGGGRDHGQNYNSWGYGAGDGIASQATEITSGGGGAQSAQYLAGGGAGYFQNGAVPTATTSGFEAQRPYGNSQGGYGSWGWGSSHGYGNRYGGFGGGGGNAAHDAGGGGGYQGGGGKGYRTNPTSQGGTCRNNGISGTISFGNSTDAEANGKVIVTLI